MQRVCNGYNYQLFTWENLKMFNITSKCFSIFYNKPPASWVKHITRDLLTCYSCLYYSSMVQAVLHSSYDIFFLNFILLSKTLSKNMTFKKQTYVKVKSRFKVKTVILWYFICDAAFDKLSELRQISCILPD